jgi:2-keto-4-pentenoate hydratase/2-oxohepta-3-ene-1,7-dioic acid hydratase in catechol pathway
MRLARFEYQGLNSIGIYTDTHVLPLAAAAAAFAQATGEIVALPGSENLLDFLPPAGPGFAAAARVASWAILETAAVREAEIPLAEVQLLVPIPRPNKLFLLAGNYAAHIEEGGGVAAERAETFPYVFMKPPTTTLTNPGQPVVVPSISPAHVDWELELAVIIGRQAKGVSEADALSFVAGYTVINDISNRKFRPNPGRKKREKDTFFDWLHGKWHDSFCPCGPCVLSADALVNPQELKMQLRVNGDLKQDASTGLQVFPVEAVIEFISSFVTLEPGDIISTGTPAGVGNTTGTYLHAGDHVEAYIEKIGTLVSPVVGE